jgi:hypothetical protein
MVDCEEVFGESSIAIMKVVPMVEYGRHQIFKATLVSQSTCFCPRIGLSALKIRSTSNKDDYINASFRPFPC